MANGKWQMVESKAMPQARARASSTISHFSFSICHDAAFTLIEMLTVIVIIVLIIGLALPVFRSLNGSRSEAGATNQIAAMLGRARAAAQGVQQPRGVAFYTDANTGQTAMVLVQPEVNTTLQTWSTTIGYPRFTYVSYGGSYYVSKDDTQASAMNTPAVDTVDWCPADVNVIDEIPDTNAELLPQGVGAQLVNDWGLATVAKGGTTQTPITDAYVSTGAIMFDGLGRLTSTPVSITQQGIVGTAMGMAATNNNNIPNWVGPSMTNAATPPAAPPFYTSNAGPPLNVYGTLYSSFGVVLYDRDAFLAQNYNTVDPTYTPGTATNAYTAGTPSEQQEERWLDQNATPLLINRYNGTLIRGQ